MLTIASGLSPWTSEFQWVSYKKNRGQTPIPKTESISVPDYFAIRDYCRNLGSSARLISIIFSMNFSARDLLRHIG